MRWRKGCFLLFVFPFSPSHFCYSNKIRLEIRDRIMQSWSAYQGDVVVLKAARNLKENTCLEFEELSLPELCFVAGGVSRETERGVRALG